jgi:hypothetical protein
MLLPVFFFLSCAVEDPPPLCDDGPHEATECGFQDQVPEEGNWRRLDNEEEGIDVIVIREIIGSGPGMTTQYALRGFALVKDGCLYCVQEEDALAYSAGMHNWWDDADATIEGVLHRLHAQFQPSDPDDPMSEWVWTYDLTGLDPASEEVLWGPIPLDLTYPDSPW